MQFLFLFDLFLKSTAREHKGKLALDSLLIMPVQRIPRYELLIQVFNFIEYLLKHFFIRLEFKIYI